MHILTHPSEHFAGDYISALRVYWPLKFLHALEIDQGLLVHTPMGTGSPQRKNNCKNLNFRLKFSVWTPITSGLVRIASPTFCGRHDELWSTNKKVIARISTYPNCTYTISWRKSIRHVILRYSFWSHLSASCHCCKRNFDYLNWLSTRTCGAGRPHIGLCHALLVKFYYVFTLRSVWVPSKA